MFVQDELLPEGNFGEIVASTSQNKKRRVTPAIPFKGLSKRQKLDIESVMSLDHSKLVSYVVS